MALNFALNTCCVCMSVRVCVCNVYLSHKVIFFGGGQKLTLTVFQLTACCNTPSQNSQTNDININVYISDSVD